jgi:phosphoribosylanthranilate isomerase
MFLKICGIQTPAEARAAVDAGATAIGMLVGLTHKAEDEIDEIRAREITVGLPGTVESVMVTHLLDEAAIARLARFIGVRAVQVHDDLPPASMRSLAAFLPGVRLIKAVHVTGSDAIERACSYATVADALLLDSRTHDRLGGTGLTHDWTISRRLVEAVAPVPTYLAGGLKPENVEDAIMTVGPAGVDVNSGVEDSQGIKDLGRMYSFLSKASAALATGLIAFDTKRIIGEPDDIASNDS